jgi:histidinol dehydrogenase
MQIFNNPTPDSWDKLCNRVEQDNTTIAERVQAIVTRVKDEGDKVLFELSEQIDRVKLSSLQVSSQEITVAESAVSEAVKQAIEIAIKNITSFHRAQLPSSVRIETQPGIYCEQRPIPIQHVGIYIPGGTAPLFSTVLMLALPAQIAGCPDITMCTPCNSKGIVAPEVLYAAKRCGVNRIYKVGGAQAIAAMAYGTESIPCVDKIFGPGNRYVTIAKQLVSSKKTAIDMPAGPSEVMVLADSSARPEYVAADLLSQAEHGTDSQTMVVCDTLSLAHTILDEVTHQASHLARTSMVEGALSHSRIIVLPERKSIIDFANHYAAEHLIISLHNPWEAATQITAAGSVFIGNYSPESAGDYASGTNHTLPTSGWARACSGVNIDSYLRKITFQELTRTGLDSLSSTITTLAQAEGLQAHAEAVRIRIKN